MFLPCVMRNCVSAQVVRLLRATHYNRCINFIFLNIKINTINCINYVFICTVGVYAVPYKPGKVAGLIPERVFQIFR